MGWPFPGVPLPCAWRPAGLRGSVASPRWAKCYKCGLMCLGHETMPVSWTHGWFSGIAATLRRAGRLPEFAQAGHHQVHGSSRHWKGKRQFLLHPRVRSQLGWCISRANLPKIVGQGLFKFIRCKHTPRSLQFLIRDKSEDLTSCGHSIPMAIST